jgi:uncharacterized protein
MAENAQTLPAPPAISVWRRREFLYRTYAHLLGAIVAFVLLEALYFSTGIAETVAGALLSVSWLLVLGGFVVVGFLGRGFAASERSRTMQYMGLGIYVVAESIIFVPLLYIAEAVAPGAISSAAVLTILGFVGLTAIAFRSGVDFTLVSGLLRWGGVMALVAIIGAVLFSFSLGAWFAIAMIGLAGVAILYDTSRALTRMADDEYVAASLELFASVALMFWYAVSLFSRR